VSRGVCFIVYGEAARFEAEQSIQSLRLFNDLPISVIGDYVIGADNIEFPQVDAGGRWAKLNIDRLVPYQFILYIDADTRVYGKLDAGFEMLEDGWDIAMACSSQQGDDLLWHVGQEEREATLLDGRNSLPLQLQAGVMFVRKCKETDRLFSAWRSEWLRWKGEDQAALLRALEVVPVRLWLLGHPWNGGALVGHRFGTIRRMK